MTAKDDMKLYPKGIGVLFIAQTFERFSYWGLQSVLVLYFVEFFHYTNAKAYSVFGTFTAFTFALSVLGGVIADKFIGFQKAVTLGILFDIVGNFLLSLPRGHSEFLGLAFMVMGTGLFSSSNANLLGNQIKSDESSLREKTFAVFYMFGNIGGLLSPILYGIISLKYGWHFCYLFSLVLLITWLIVFHFQKHKLITAPSLSENNNKGNNYIALFAMLVVVGITYLLLQLSFAAGILLGCIGAATCLSLLYLAFKEGKLQRNAILLLLFSMLFVLVFFALEFQVNSSLLIFANQHINRFVFGWTIPTPSLASIEPFFVITLTPIIAFFWGKKSNIKDRESPVFMKKFIVTFLLTSIGFCFFYLMAKLSGSAVDSKTSISWLIFGNVFLGAAEIYLMPTIISAIAEYCPSRFKGTLMGTLYLAAAFSGYLAGLIASLTTPTVSQVSQSTQAYANVYFNLAMASFVMVIASALIYFFARRVKLSSGI